MSGNPLGEEGMMAMGDMLRLGFKEGRPAMVCWRWSSGQLMGCEALGWERRKAPHTAAEHNTAQHSTAQHSTAQHSTATPTHALFGPCRVNTSLQALDLSNVEAAIEGLLCVFNALGAEGGEAGSYNQTLAALVSGAHKAHALGRVQPAQALSTLPGAQSLDSCGTQLKTHASQHT